MRSKETRTPNMCRDVMEYCLCNSDAVIGGSAAAEFVEDDEGAGCGFCEDFLGFGEFDEEGRLGGEDVVVCAEARHDAVDGCEGG